MTAAIPAGSYGDGAERSMIPLSTSTTTGLNWLPDSACSSASASSAGAPGWQLSRARVVSGNNSYRKGSRSLEISGGGVATSPTVCVGLEHPTMRFFVKSSGGLLSLSTMTVEVLAETSVGLVVPVPIGLVLPNTKWKPSGRYLVVANLLPLLPQSYTPVAFRFRAIGGATWTIDDVYVDPKHR